MMAIPWRPRSPLTSTASPGTTRVGEISIPGGTRPTPAVLMKMPSPLPRSTTLVSPVMIRTPAACAATCIDATIRRSVSSGRPSSKMNAALR
jgi:hypothetical protein